MSSWVARKALAASQARSELRMQRSKALRDLGHDPGRCDACHLDRAGAVVPEQDERGPTAETLAGASEAHASKSRVRDDGRPRPFEAKPACLKLELSRAREVAVLLPGDCIGALHESRMRFRPPGGIGPDPDSDLRKSRRRSRRVPGCLSWGSVRDWGCVYDERGDHAHSRPNHSLGVLVEQALARPLRGLSRRVRWQQHRDRGGSPFPR